MTNDDFWEPLLKFLESVPTIRLPAGRKSIGRGAHEAGWWVKFYLDLSDPLALRVVQEFAHVLNLLSNEDRLPTVFKPVSPPPYLNGGVEFLSWVIEADGLEFTPKLCAAWLESRLPRPVTDLAAWSLDEEPDTDG